MTQPSFQSAPAPPSGARVVVAMSGGVDSAVAAALMVEAGYDVVGVTLQLYDHGAATRGSQTCCAGQDIGDAARVAEKLGIPHYVLDYEARFRRDVIEAFADAYAAGETPVPCIACNRTVKFRDLLATARELGAAALATGHYVRRLDGADGPALHAAVEAARDQSYFLFATTREQLAFLHFPIGDLRKAEVRAIAARLGLPVADKPDSQDICFVPTGRYADIVGKLRPGAAEPGDIVDLEGKVLARHGGIANFTVGQRRGIGVGTGEKLFVVRIEPQHRRVVVGPRAALAATEVPLAAVNWIGPSVAPGQAVPVAVKLRSAQPLAAATLTLDGHGNGTVRLGAPAFGVAPGQACVFYDGARLLGGGWIRRAEAPAMAAEAAPQRHAFA